MKKNNVVKLSLLILGLLFLERNEIYAQKSVPIQFEEYNFSVETPFKKGDTIAYKYNSNEFFKIVFFDFRGKCYFERYINNELHEKGQYENSLDTLKKYVANKYNRGKSSKIFVLKYFQPLKDGLWITITNGTLQKRLYIMGVPANKLIR